MSYRQTYFSNKLWILKLNITKKSDNILQKYFKIIPTYVQKTNKQGKYEVNRFWAKI